MGLKINNISLNSLSCSERIRLWLPFILPRSSYSYDKLTDFLEIYESGRRPKGGIDDRLKNQALNLGGEQIDKNGSVDLSKAPYVPMEFFAQSPKGQVRDQDVLVCKDGALTGKSCLVEASALPTEQVMVNEHVYILRSNSKMHQKFLYYFTRSSLFQAQVKDLAYRKKAQPGLNIEHLRKIKVPSIPLDIQLDIIKKISPLEKKMKQLRRSSRFSQEIIDDVFIRVFDIDFKSVEMEDSQKKFVISSTLPFRNPNLRMSARWHKIAPIQKALYANVSCLKKLGQYIISTKNGWSPPCDEGDSLNLVLGLNCITTAGSISFEDVKFTNATRSNIEAYFARRFDLFVSRGNTPDLVALASVVENLPIDRDVIFPDLFIRLDIDESRLRKKYVAFMFNSLIGRYYFKYSAKGKNQTMVKISADEIKNLFIPVPSIETQDSIINEIEDLLKIEGEIQSSISQVASEVDAAIEECLGISFHLETDSFASNQKTVPKLPVK